MCEKMNKILIVIQKGTLERAWDSTKGSRQKEKVFLFEMRSLQELILQVAFELSSECSF